jgi:DNA-binding CsgD family transcriptional regulator/uncharacterized protein Usg
MERWLMQGSQEQLQRWLNQHYQLGTDQMDLGDSFDFLKHHFNADVSSVVLAHRQRPEQAMIWTRSYSQSDMDYYFRHMTDDVLLNSYMANNLVGKAVIADQLVDFERIDNPVFRDCLIPYFRSRYALCVLSPVGPEQDLVITLHRHFGHAPFTEQARSQLQIMVDALVSWAHCFSRLRLMEQDRGMLTHLLERDPRPRGVINHQGELHFSNDALNRVLMSSRFVRLQHQQIQLAPALQRRWLMELALPQPGRLLIGRSECFPLLLEWFPLPSLVGRFEITLLDPAREYARHPERLKTLYHLSDAEQEVLLLLSRGLTGPEVAHLRGVAKETLRTQLKSLLHKTRTNNQNELLNLLFNISR